MGDVVVELSVGVEVVGDVVSVGAAPPLIAPLAELNDDESDGKPAAERDEELDGVVVWATTAPGSATAASRAMNVFVIFLNPL